MSFTEQVYRTIIEAQGPVNAVDVAEEMGADRSQVASVFNRAMEAGVLKRVGRGTYSVNRKKIQSLLGEEPTELGDTHVHVNNSVVSAEIAPPLSSELASEFWRRYQEAGTNWARAQTRVAELEAKLIQHGITP